ncbi:MAG: CRISPR-associated protein Cas4 [Ruminococcus sp.]|nr:CRISPR-associated protein Cas4 [Ruminococcus sp.]
MEYREEDFLMLSGVQHFAFCRRQWALIHIEMLWEENLRTAEGEKLHDICHDGFFDESRGNVIISRAMPIFSRTLGASGECDVVEFKRSKTGINLDGREGNYTVYPIEYKHGEPKEDDCDIMQLAAQAICLEEMLVCEVKKGAIYYGKTRRRLEVEITMDIKNKVRESFEQMHRYIKDGHIPTVKTSRRCSACSLKELCIPKLQKITSVKKYLDENLGECSDK